LAFSGIDAQPDNMKKYRNPFGIGNYINHPPPGSQSNVFALQYDAASDRKDMSSIPSNLLHYMPNQMPDPTKFDFLNCNFVPSLIMLATRHIEDEELFLNYRFKPGIPLPGWYTQPDEEEAKQRWSTE